ncbi:inactive serine protease 35-like [Brienomyrus brachyistius]|uniref:inactive serine protease 35-like n=1 Tax=Brienomyrus brachyistius TaxID=42636 RepID=UPI0020B2AF0B|nr:inactive serine protease 35-like [Brienomyrus brachyistius]
MGPGPLILSVLMLGVAVGMAKCEDDDDEYTWPRNAMPVLRDKQTVVLARPTFTAEAGRDPRSMCGIECQSRIPEPSMVDLEELLSYETVNESGARTLTEVSLQGLAGVRANHGYNASTPAPRRKRQVYGTDSRFVIADKQFTTNYPFSTTVKVSTGCSGILLSPRHVLTAAHCIHDGRDYLKGAQRLRVGMLKLRSRRGAGRRGGRGRGGKRKGGDGEDGGGERPRGKKRRGRRSAEAMQPSFRWTRVKQMRIPKGWFGNVSQELAVDYDYALLDLKRPQKQKFMDLGIIPSVKNLPARRIHFSGFDDDRPEQLVYRFCTVSDESSDLLYQYCDARPGSAGSGVYVRLKEPGKKKWKRKIIAVFSGHKWVDVKGEQRDYNVAVRITPAKYAQVCHWIHGDSSLCREL